MMSNIFNIKRFGLIFRKDMMENWKRYTLQFMAMIGIITVITTYVSFSFFDDMIKYPGYYGEITKELGGYIIAMCFVFGALFASTFMNPVNSKVKKISYLSNPASCLEKYFTRWLITTVGYIISFFIALCIAELLRVGICSAFYPDVDVEFISIAEYKNENEIVAAIIFITSFYFLLQSLFILGSTFWEKATFVKTFSALIIFILLVIFACRILIAVYYEDFYSFERKLNSFMMKKTFSQIVFYFSLTFYFFAITNWVLTFFRLRESEIIKRL